MNWIEFIRLYLNKEPKKREIQDVYKEIIDLESQLETAIDTNNQAEIYKLEIRLNYRLDVFQELIYKYAELGYNTIDMQIKHDKIKSWLVVLHNQKNYKNIFKSIEK